MKSAWILLFEMGNLLPVLSNSGNLLGYFVKIKGTSVTPEISYFTSMVCSLIAILVPSCLATGREKCLKWWKQRKYWLIWKNNKRFKISLEWQLWFLDILSKNQSQSISILEILYFFLKIPVSCFVGSFLSNSFVYLVFGNIMWKLENINFYDQPW